MTVADLDKLAGQELRDFACSDGLQGRQSVIAEVRTAFVTTPYPAILGMPLPIEIMMTQDAVEVGPVLDEVERKLDTLVLPASPVRLDTAEAFVLDVTPAQLLEIASWDEIGIIRPNRTHVVIP